MAQKRLLIVCGEASGDQNASLLLRALKSRDPALECSAVGGEQLRLAGARIIRDIGELSVMGLFDVLAKLPLFLRLKNDLLALIKTQRPDAVILTDFSGFNLRFAEALNKTVPVIYYISPQVWASREGRVETIRRCISRMIVIFEFEKEFYGRRGINADFVGHPLLDVVKPTMDKGEFFRREKLADGVTTIALLPGSRRQELRLILPVMLEAGKLIKESLGSVQFLIAKPAHLDQHLYRECLEHSGLKAAIVEGKMHDCLNAADFCLVTSGTATLETAIMEKPFVLVYKMNPLNYLLYRPQVKLPCIGMVNIVAGRKIIPEFIQFNARPETIAGESLAILKNPARMEQMRRDLADIRAKLGSPGAADRAARIILDMLP